MKIKMLVGYQIESSDGTHEIPDTFWSFEIFSEQDVDKWLSEHNYESEGKPAWMKVPIYDGDVENPDFVDIYYPENK